MISKFNLYDFIANLIPGLVFLWCLEWMSTRVGVHLPFDFAGGLAETSILVALGYVTGLLLQALSERITQQRILLKIWGGFPSARWLLPDDPHLSGAYKQRVFELIKERFGVSVEPECPEQATPQMRRELSLKKNQELFFLCYNHVDNLSARPYTFDVHYGLFRCLLTLFVLLCILAVALGLWNLLVQPEKQPVFLILPVVFASLGWLSYERCKKRADDFAKSVYDLFIAGVASKPSS